MNKSLELEKNPGWREARDLTLSLYRLSVTGNLNFDLGLRDSLRNAAVTLMSHISLSHHGFDKKFSLIHLCYARAGTASLYALLLVSRDVGYMSEGDFLDFEDRIHRICDQIEGKIKKFGPPAAVKTDFPPLFPL